MDTDSFISRKEETKTVRTRYPDQVPVVIRTTPGSTLPSTIEGAKFLVGADFTMSDFLMVVRRKINLPKTNTLVMFAGNRELITGEQKLGEIYCRFADRDGFLYFWCYDQSTLG